jgi:hypothetical protein
LISDSRFRASAISKLFCMRIKVSIDTPNAFTMGKAISAERWTRSFRSADSTGRVTPSARAGLRHGESEGFDNLALYEAARMGGRFSAQALRDAHCGLLATFRRKIEGETPVGFRADGG